jgi:hypothetical protein
LIPIDGWAELGPGQTIRLLAGHKIRLIRVATSSHVRASFSHRAERVFMKTWRRFADFLGFSGFDRVAPPLSRMPSVCRSCLQFSFTAVHNSASPQQVKSKGSKIAAHSVNGRNGSSSESGNGSAVSKGKQQPKDSARKERKRNESSK